MFTEGGRGIGQGPRLERRAPISEQQGRQNDTEWARGLAESATYISCYFLPPQWWLKFLKLKVKARYKNCNSAYITVSQKQIAVLSYSFQYLYEKYGSILWKTLLIEARFLTLSLAGEVLRSRRTVITLHMDSIQLDLSEVLRIFNGFVMGVSDSVASIYQRC